MHLDENGLICTLEDDGTLDKNDQLQRVSMCFLANNHVGSFHIDRASFISFFEPSPGVMVRYPGGRANDVSGDALISALAAMVRRQEWRVASDISWQTLVRGGFSQNIYDMYGRTTKKTPDFILLRALSLMWRSNETLILFRHAAFAIVIALCTLVSMWFFPLLIFVTDIPLVFMVIASRFPVWKDDKGFVGRTDDDVDDNVPIMTFIACASTFPTILSSLMPHFYAWLRPWNLGCRDIVEMGGNPVTLENAYGPVFGALRWYHRGPKGNPEIAELYRPLVERYFGEKNKGGHNGGV